MAKVNQAEALKINECAQVIALTGHKNTIVLEGEPGVGKSSILKLLEEMLGDKYEYIYVDCATKDMGDVSMNIPVHDHKQLEQYAAKLFNLTSDKPKVLMLDEIWKTDKMMKKIWTRLILERYVGDQPLPQGSIVFGTSNNASDGVGDNLEGHVGNRVTRIRFKKPSAKEWNVWAGDHGISPLTRAWTEMNQECMRSYTELNDTELSQNPFIFNPKRNTSTFVSGRSLEKNDLFVRSRSLLGEKVTLAAMSGTVGQAAAESMSSFFLIEKDLIPVRQIIASPKKVPIPTNVGALLMILFNAIDEIETQDDLSSFMEFVERLESSEMQSVFYTSVCQSKRTVKLAKNNKALSEWMIRHFYLFT